MLKECEPAMRLVGMRPILLLLLLLLLLLRKARNQHKKEPKAHQAHFFSAFSAWKITSLMFFLRAPLFTMIGT